MTCPFTLEQLREITLKIFPRSTVSLNRKGDKYWLLPYDEVQIYPADGSWTYDDMKRLSDALGTTQLNFHYQKETDAYSTWTSGDPSEMKVVVRWSDAAKEEGQ